MTLDELLAGLAEVAIRAPEHKDAIERMVLHIKGRGFGNAKHFNLSYWTYEALATLLVKEDLARRGDDLVLAALEVTFQWTANPKEPRKQEA